MMEKLVSEDEYRDALKRFLELSDCSAGSLEAQELEQLMILLEIYEHENCPNPYVD